MPRKIVAEDENALAAKTVSAATGQPIPTGVLDALLKRQAAAKEASKNPAAVALGRLGGLKGGKARAEALSPTKRSAIAKAAAKARWGKDAALVKLIGSGMSTAELSKKLHLSPAAIEAHRKKLREKLVQSALVAK